MTISKELLDELLKDVERPEDLLGDAGLMRELKIRLMEQMLGAELTAHLGYEEGKEAPPGQANRRNGSSTKVLKDQDGELPVAVPCDRDSSFKPGQRRCVNLVSLHMGMGDSLDLKRIGDHHPLYMRRQNPGYRHGAVAQDGVIAQAQPGGNVGNGPLARGAGNLNVGRHRTGMKGRVRPGDMVHACIP